MPHPHHPFHPIIYVRGYAMTAGEIDATTADPFCGFNLGSTVFRAVPDRKSQPRQYIFQSPVVRLASDFQYQNVYQDGYDILDPEWDSTATGEPSNNKLPVRSIIIFRYYDAASQLLGTGATPPIEVFAEQLAALILRVRELVCRNPDNGMLEDEFQCYLVAHSMGGLVCRALLQHPAAARREAAGLVDKLFTYATPHNGIDVAGIDPPRGLGIGDINNFNRERMADYLNLNGVPRPDARVDWLPEAMFSSEKVFCMIGTNRSDYQAALGLSRTFVGHGSDGLVKIENAALYGLQPDGTPGAPCAKAYAYRSHSGYFGIVNSEEAYQNLARFLFGDVRVDVWFDLTAVRLPLPVQQQCVAGHAVNALYQIEVTASPRGKLWYLTRRIAEEDSVACVSHREYQQQGPVVSRYLSSVFLANRARVDPQRRSLAYAMTFGIKVPDYEIDRKLWINEHYEGGYLFRDTIILEMTPPEEPGQAWRVTSRWQGNGVNPATANVTVQAIMAGKVEVRVPLPSNPAMFPGVSGVLRFVVSAWNGGA